MTTEEIKALLALLERIAVALEARPQASADQEKLPPPHPPIQAVAPNRKLQTS